MELFDAYLEELVLSKAFEDLSPAESAYVLERITEAEYADYHFILKAIAEGYHVDVRDLMPDSDISATLKEHFDAKFQPLRQSLGLNIFQPLNIYRSVAVLGLIAIIIGFFVINGTYEKIHVQKPRRSIVQSAPSERTPVEIDQIERTSIEENATPAKVRRAVQAPGNAKLKSPVAVVPAIKIEKDLATAEAPDLLCLNIHEPLLCLDVDFNQQIPGLYDGTNTVDLLFDTVPSIP